MQRSARERVSAFPTRHPVHGRGRAGLRALVLGVALVATLAGCSDVSETLWPSMSGPDPRGGGQVAAAQAPVAQAPAIGALTAPAPSGPIQTQVGQRARQLREEAQRLLNSVLARGNRIQQIRGEAVQHVQGYESTVGAINARLAVGTTAGNPVLQQQWQLANQQLDLIGGDVGRLSGVTNEVAGDSGAAQAALREIGRTFSMPGAVEDDHRFLVNAEDDINRAIVLNNRQLGEVNTDTTRLSNYVQRARPTLGQLANAIASGQLTPGSQIARGGFVEESNTRPRSSAVSSSPLRSVGGRPAAPSRATPARGTPPSRATASRTTASRAAPPPRQAAAAAPAAASGGRRPLVTIRFDRPNPAYEQPLYTAVSRALERRPSATFDLVAVAPGRGRQPGNAAALARADAQKVLRTLTDMGLPSNRVNVSSTTGATLTSSEVHLYVR
jgi:hypothetical protein